MPQLVPENILQQRYSEHYAHIKIFLEAWHKRDCGPEMVVNENALFLTIKSAYDDIYRYKLYHLDADKHPRSNGVKRAAFLCKWIIKFKPIEYADNARADSLHDISGLIINADFSQWMARVHISADKGGSHFQFSNRYLFELLYDLTFRELTGDALLHIFQNAHTHIVDKEELYTSI
jgi:hypothetical protein